MSDYFVCPHCGAEVDIDAVVCPECGSDETTGWAEGAEYADLFLNDDYESQKKSKSKSTIPWQKIILIVVSLLIVASLLISIFSGLTYLAIFLIVGGVGAYYLLKKKEGSASNNADKTYQELFTRARGDVALVERWIAYERSRTPDASRQKLMEAALYRWERDNR